jgi:hypothetical protein
MMMRMMQGSTEWCAIPCEAMARHVGPGWTAFALYAFAILVGGFVLGLGIGRGGLRRW